jgi:hypothetical protein
LLRDNPAASKGTAIALLGVDAENYDAIEREKTAHSMLSKLKNGEE